MTQTKKMLIALLSSLLLLSVIFGIYSQHVASTLRNELDNDYKRILFQMHTTIDNNNDKELLILELLKFNSQLDVLGTYTSYNNNRNSLSMYTKHLNNYFTNFLILIEKRSIEELQSLSTSFYNLSKDPSNITHINTLLYKTTNVDYK